MTYGGFEYQAKVLGINDNEDIAILFVEDATFPYLQIADMEAMKTGDDIYAIGAPKGMAYTLTKGSISAKERMIGSRAYIQIDAAINEGNSGGPLLNDAGQVLGMNTLKMSDSEGIGLAIPVNRICDYLETLEIELDSNGIVVNSVVVPENPVPIETEDNKEENKTDYEKDEKLPTITYVAFAVAALSLAGNIVLAILLIYQNKKNINLKYDPRERTDFDIDVWE